MKDGVRKELDLADETDFPKFGPAAFSSNLSGPFLFTDQRISPELLKERGWGF